MPSKTVQHRLLRPTFVYPAIALILIAFVATLAYKRWTYARSADLDSRYIHQLAAASDRLDSVLSNLESALEQAERNALKPEERPAFLREQVGLQSCSPSATTSRAYPKLQRDVLVFPVSKSVNPGSRNARRPAEIDFPHCYPVSNLIDRGLAPVFDDIVVFTGRGEGVFQTRRTGLRISDLAAVFPKSGAQQPREPQADDKARDSKAAEKPGLIDSGSRKEKNAPDTVGLISSVFKETIGGRDYRIYLSPALARNREVPDPSQKLVLAGVIREEVFEDRANSLPLYLTLWMGILAIAILAGSGPILMFYQMRITERLGKFVLMRLSMSAFVFVAVLWIGAIHLIYGSAPSADTERELRQLAASLDQHVSSETKAALTTLVSLSSCSRFQTINVPLLNGAKSTLQFAGFETNALQQLYSQTARYPYFDNVFWADEFGNQRIKWTLRRELTPYKNVAEYQVADRIRSQQLWQFADPAEPWAPAFRIDPLYSPNTGEYVALVSIDARKYKQHILSASMVTPLLSLIDPILRPGFGFAVIGNTGNVLFHSEKERNGRESLFDTCAPSEHIKQAVALGTDVFLRLTCDGEEVQAFVSPFTSMQRCPWTLVTFEGSPRSGRDMCRRF